MGREERKEGRKEGRGGEGRGESEKGIPTHATEPGKTHTVEVELVRGKYKP